VYYCLVRPPAWIRALIAIWGLWFTAALSEAPGIHTCAVHGDHAGHAAGAGHAGHMVHGSAPSAPADSQRAPATCTCLGLCCCVAPVAEPAASIDLPESIVRVAVTAPVGSLAISVVLRAHSLPFANGPPRA
jgi:hypothetical protein